MGVVVISSDECVDRVHVSSTRRSFGDGSSGKSLSLILTTKLEQPSYKTQKRTPNN